MIIKINDLKIPVSLGVYGWEKEKPTEVKIELALEYDAGNAAESDDLADTLDYAVVEEVIVVAVRSRHFNLLESLIAEIGRVVTGFPRVQMAAVSVSKPGALKYAEYVTIQEVFRA